MIKNRKVDLEFTIAGVIGFIAECDNFFKIHPFGYTVEVINPKRSMKLDRLSYYEFKDILEKLYLKEYGI